MDKIKILVADDHPLVRSGIMNLLAGQDNMEVIGEAGSGEECVEKVKLLKPDVVILDISMPGISGLEAVGLIKKEVPSAAIVILTMHEEKEYMYNTLRLPIDGLLHKSAGKEEIIDAVKSAASGVKYYGKAVKEILVNNFVDKYPDTEKKEEPLLTKREKDILVLVAEGLSSYEISEKLSISHRTVDTHRSNLIQKFNLKSSFGLLKFALDFVNSQRKTT